MTMYITQLVIKTVRIDGGPAKETVCDWIVTELPGHARCTGAKQAHKQHEQITKALATLTRRG